MGLTTDPESPCLREIQPSGMQKCYLVLSEEERAKGFVMPVHRSYTHLKCGTVTTMVLALCETYARNPKFYGGTFCCGCGAHFRLLDYGREASEAAGRDIFKHAFEWPDGTPVGSTPEEAEAVLAARKADEASRFAGERI